MQDGDRVAARFKADGSLSESVADRDEVTKRVEKRRRVAAISAKLLDPGLFRGRERRERFVWTPTGKSAVEFEPALSR